MPSVIRTLKSQKMFTVHFASFHALFSARLIVVPSLSVLRSKAKAEQVATLELGLKTCLLSKLSEFRTAAFNHADEPWRTTGVVVESVEHRAKNHLKAFVLFTLK